MRDAAEREVLSQVERERQQVDDALAGLRTTEATRLDRRVVEAGDVALDTVLEVMQNGESDFNRLKAVELWLEMARNGTVVSREQPAASNAPQLPPPQHVSMRLPPMDGLKPGSDLTIRRPDGWEMNIKTPPDAANVIDVHKSSDTPES